MSTPALSPRPRESSHTTQSWSRPMAAPTPVSRASSVRSPLSSNPPVLTPRRVNQVKTPAAHEPKTPSPNYFGVQVDPNSDVFASSAAQHVRGNWSPPSSNVRSAAAASPRVIPVDQNPEFEQFKRQSESRGTFALGSFDFGSSPPFPAPRGSVFGTMKPPLSPQSVSIPLNTHDGSDDQASDGSGSTTASKPRSPKRLLSTESSAFPDRPRRNSPASFLDQEGYGHTDEVAEFADDRSQRPSLPANRSIRSVSNAHYRAQTLPVSLLNEEQNQGPRMVTPEHVVNILESSVDEVLLLDLRVSTQYARGRIAGALSLCIPTTLLKRASFNVRKLAETFKDEELRQKFENWRSSKHIVVYDTNSSTMKDATICINTLKKFESEGWKGGSYIIRGGFQEFSEKFPSWTTNGAAVQSPTSTSSKASTDLPAVAPVIGGCPMPATQNAANPFFGNIRQNMDLIGGVGQMPIKHPASMTQSLEEELPSWLQAASNAKDNGKLVADKFLHIEKREQKRMQEALSGKVVYGTTTTEGQPPKSAHIQIAGIEKGSKNRYNSIWPYEHSRVKLEGVDSSGCDYINANHVQSSFSNKRYIATQGPLPATFNDFWKVVWQQDVRVIVMLTAEQEGGQLKAHNYWSNKQYDHLHLNELGERKASLEPSKIHKHREQWRPPLGQRRSTNPPKSAFFTKEATTAPSPQNNDQPYVTVRKFTLSNDEEPFERMREITQLQYSHWPDFGAPAHPRHLLGLIEQCDAVCRQVNGGSPSRPDPPNTRPVLVHCSAGCGRTGTFCTVDSVLDMLKRQRQARNVRQSTPMELDPLSPNNAGKATGQEKDWTTQEDIDLIEKTVEDFRLQRLSMVQSLRQFALCYESVLEWLAEQHPKSA
ncbi:tyrosine-protein phosphatase non-receptor type 6 [Periconia macrospinosa]|uniref:protein-tyrosine-phosphatase n=1 Tax=Periconia macrospinosa TaxID=97972 RepID=A0A2V1E405_9PLEO|nr:tyrosine-protein phosphatase non-receptor type 6 [Periconia macrospinosa]